MNICRGHEILALIPARGGSKGIPGKNLLMLAGKPLVAYSIEQALASRHITRTIVSTDDAEIADVARAHGAEVPFMRPGRIARDLSPDVDVFRHALGWLQEHEGYRCELVVHLRPTAPVRRVPIIDEAVEIMCDRPNADSLRSVSLAQQSPYKMWRLDGGYLKPLLATTGESEPHSLPRQKLPPVYWQNGYVDIIRPRVVMELGMMAGHEIACIVIHDPIPELDYPEDIPRLEVALLALNRGEWPPASATAVRHPV